MAYTLQAIITSPSVRVMVVERNLSCVNLDCGCLCMVPFPHDYIEEHGIPFLPLTDDGCTIGQELDELCRFLSQFAKAAYVEAEYFGGTGTQACALFENSQPASEPLVDDEAINHALRWLGVQRDHERDEFDAAGFGRHRHTEDWMKDK